LGEVKKRNRQYRRHQRDRKKRVAQKMLLNNWGWGDSDITVAVIGKMATTPKMCSSYCCGNPRKWFNEATVQQRRAMQ
jgi:hypothetical protein